MEQEKKLFGLLWIDCLNSEWIWRTLSSNRKESHMSYILKLRICKAAAVLPTITWGWGMVVPNLGCYASAANEQTQVTQHLRVCFCWKQHLSANPKLIPQSRWGSWNNTPTYALASVLSYTPGVIAEAHQLGRTVIHSWEWSILKGPCEKRPFSCFIGFTCTKRIGFCSVYWPFMSRQWDCAPLVVLGAKSLTLCCPPFFIFFCKRGMWAYRATGRLGIYHWPENSSVCDQGSWPSTRLNGRLMGNRSKPDRLWGALFSLPPPVIHHISSWYWEILVPHWQEGQGSRQRRAAAGLRQGELEQISFIFIKHVKYKACRTRCVLLKASEMSRQTNAKRPCPRRELSRTNNERKTMNMKGVCAGVRVKH